MKNYLSASLAAVTISSLITSAIYILSGYCFLVIGSSTDIAWAIIVTTSSLLFSILTNLLFVAPLKNDFLKLASLVSKITFAGLFSAYGGAIFLAAYGFLNLTLAVNFSNSEFLPLLTNAVANGFVYGWVFCVLWKPIFTTN